jgi:hypothetical protein
MRALMDNGEPHLACTEEGRMSVCRIRIVVKRHNRGLRARCKGHMSVTAVARKGKLWSLLEWFDCSTRFVTMHAITRMWHMESECVEGTGQSDKSQL